MHLRDSDSCVALFRKGSPSGGETLKNRKRPAAQPAKAKAKASESNDDEEEEEEKKEEGQELEEALRSFVMKHYNQGNGMATTTTVPVRAGGRVGYAQLKWWKNAGHLLIKTVELTRGSEPKHAVTAAARAVLEDPTLQALGLRSVCMESVLSRDLLAKLKAKGWRLDMYGSNNAWLVTPGTCYFCGGGYGEFGNSCEPLASAPWRCCDDCNAQHVIFARIRTYLSASDM